MSEHTRKIEANSNVPQKIFGMFLGELENQEISADVIERLGKVLSQKEMPNELEIKKAIFSDL